MEELARRAPSVQASYTNLDREYEVVKKQYDALLTRREAARVGDNAQRRGAMMTIRTIDAREVPIKPAGPNRSLLLSAVLVAGLAAGVGLAFGLSRADDSYGTTTALSALGLPILGSIGFVPALDRRRMNRSAEAGAFGFACAGILAVYGVLMLRLAMGWQAAPERASGMSSRPQRLG